MALAEHAAAGTDPSPEEILESLSIVGCLGSGSNSAVLDVRRDEVRLALKVVSHFWVEDAQDMLDSERQILCSLPDPGHPGVIKLHAEFIGDIPESVAEHLPSDMRQHYDAWLEEHDGALPRTQFYLLDAHPISLHAWSAKMPLPLPYPLLHRLATDLLAAVAFLNENCIVHLDCKADNVLMARDGRAVLCDFGIARRTPDDSLDLPLVDPSELLLNRLVLAPEVLHAHEEGEARAAAAAQAAEEADVDDDNNDDDGANVEDAEDDAQGDAEDEAVAQEAEQVLEHDEMPSDSDAAEATDAGDEDGWGDETAAEDVDIDASPDPDDDLPPPAPVCVLPLAGQGVWAAGVCLLEAAVGWSPFPRYPEQGDGVEAGPGGFGVRYSDDGADVVNACPMYPQVFRQLLRALVAGDPSQRPSPAAALAALASPALFPKQRVPRLIHVPSSGIVVRPARQSRVSSCDTETSASTALSNAVSVVFCNVFGEREMARVVGVEPMAVAVMRTSQRFRRLPPPLMGDDGEDAPVSPSLAQPSSALRAERDASVDMSPGRHRSSSTSALDGGSPLGASWRHAGITDGLESPSRQRSTKPSKGEHPPMDIPQPPMTLDSVGRAGDSRRPLPPGGAAPPFGDPLSPTGSGAGTEASGRRFVQRHSASMRAIVAASRTASANLAPPGWRVLAPATSASSSFARDGEHVWGALARRDSSPPSPVSPSGSAGSSGQREAGDAPLSSASRSIRVATGAASSGAGGLFATARPRASSSDDGEAYDSPPSPTSESDGGVASNPPLRLMLGAVELAGHESAAELKRECRRERRFVASTFGLGLGELAASASGAGAWAAPSDRVGSGPLRVASGTSGRALPASRLSRRDSSGSSLSASAGASDDDLEDSIVVWVLPCLDECCALSQRFALAVLRRSAAFAAAVAMPTEEDLAASQPSLADAAAAAPPRRFSVPATQSSYSWERVAGVEALALDDTPEEGDWRVQLRAVQCLGIVAARAYEADSASQVLDVHAFTRAVIEFASAWSDRDHCLGLAMSAIRNVSCIASEACAVRMARLRSLEWAAYAHSQLPEGTQVTEDALNLCINLLRFPAVCEPDSDAGELDLPALAALAVSASLHHRENSALLDAALSLALSLTEVGGDSDEGSEALARAGILHSADVVLYEARRDRHRVVQVLHLVSTILASAKARELPESIHAADLVTRCISLVSRDQYADDEELTNLCLLCIRNAACVTAVPERVGVAAVSARYSGVVRVDEAMTRFPASEDVQENGRCAMFNLLVASEARASDLERLASRHDRRGHRSRSEGSASLAASLAELPEPERSAAAAAPDSDDEAEGRADVGSQTEFAAGGAPGSSAPASPGAPLPGGYASTLEGASSHPGPGSDDEDTEPPFQARVPFAAEQQALAVPAAASQPPQVSETAAPAFALAVPVGAPADSLELEQLRSDLGASRASAKRRGFAVAALALLLVAAIALAIAGWA
ncbi:hypothetical protein FNF29_00397 [Cafeteria roenbergensis]|uniref:Protein kinase domain-containing protein n=1 Tax=Cafeteria roenbergensis TaxID=33653 RepID=A0A5A8CVJ1_CAFRO|nr:hypothetical protein FNF29_00397 [Cafeteria roenbergensis]|eukprot:KAA0157045.1 hypothetical protein FNF29_00397 [Cafeteria roenbergensis]